MIQIKLYNKGTVNKNAVTIEKDGKGIYLAFSFNTLVAVNGTVSQNEWGKTTGRYLNLLEPDKSRRVPHEQVLEEAQRCLVELLGE